MTKELPIEPHGCPINCSGGCPYCASDEHTERCVLLYEGTIAIARRNNNILQSKLDCICDEAE